MPNRNIPFIIHLSFLVTVGKAELTCSNNNTASGCLLCQKTIDSEHAENYCNGHCEWDETVEECRSITSMEVAGKST